MSNISDEENLKNSIAYISRKTDRLMIDEKSYLKIPKYIKQNQSIQMVGDSFDSFDSGTLDSKQDAQFS